MALPWDMVISALPVLIESAGRLWKRADASAKQPDVQGSLAAQVEAIKLRLEQSERIEAEQAQLLRQTIEQLQQTALRAAALERRANLAIGIAAAAAVAAGLALFAR